MSSGKGVSSQSPIFFVGLAALKKKKACVNFGVKME